MERLLAAVSIGLGLALTPMGPATASDWLDDALESGEAFLRDAEEAADGATDAMGEWAGDAADWFDRQYRSGSDLSAEQVEQFLIEIETLNDYARDAGYRLERFDVGLGLVPEVRLHYRLERQLDAEELAELLERIDRGELSVLQRYVLSALLTASEYGEQLRLGDYALAGVWITLAIPPNVRLVFVPED